MPALVVCIDGPDGVGKTTQIELLKSKFANLKVHYTRSSGGTALASMLRSASLSPHPRSGLVDFHISMAMGYSLADDIAIKVNQFDIIVIDRSPLSYVAYNAYGSDINNKGAVMTACKSMLKEWSVNQIIYLDASPITLDSRLDKRSNASKSDYFESKPDSFRQRVLSGYKHATKELKEDKYWQDKLFIVNAEKSVNEVNSKIENIIKQQHDLKR